MASRLQAASLIDVRFSIKANESSVPIDYHIRHSDSIEYCLQWYPSSAIGPHPAGDYLAGRIDTFDGIACDGTSSNLSAVWMGSLYARFGIIGDVAASWGTMDLGRKQYWCDHQNLSWDGGVTYSNWDWVPLTDRWQLRPGDVAVLQGNPAFPDELGEPYHYIIIHRVGLQSGVWYGTSNKGAGDGLGYYEELQDGAGLIGCFRVGGLRDPGYRIGGGLAHQSIPDKPAGLYWLHGTKPVTTQYWIGGEWITVTVDVLDGKLIVPMTNGSLTADIRFLTERDNEGHATVSSYVNDELMYSLHQAWVVPVESMVNSLYISAQHPWETMRVGDVEATIWLGDGGGFRPDRRREEVMSWTYLGFRPWVLSADKLVPDSIRTVRRSWRKWFEYFTANPLQPDKYTSGGDLWGNVENNAPIDRTPHGVPGAVEWADGIAVDSDGYVYGNAGAAEDTRFYDYTGYFWLYFYATCRGNTVCAVTDRAYRTKLAWVAEGGSHVQFRLVERPADPSTWGEIVTVFIGTDCRHPSLAAYDDGVITCWYMAYGSGDTTGDRQHASISTDDGRTWQELTNMMGSQLRNVAVTQHHGITLGVGVENSRLFFVRSNDQGRTQDNQPNGEPMLEIGACASDCRPSITWYPDGEVAVWAETDDGETVTYHNTSSGYANWTVVP